MATSSVNNSGYISQTELNNLKPNTRTPQQELGKDEFLQLLAVQLANQDPLQPMEDTDFIAQMAQFTSLEQMSQLNESFGTQRAYSLIGKNVVGTLDDNTEVLGTVTGVTRMNNIDYLHVGAYKLPLANVKEIYDTGVDSNSLIANSAHLVGKQVEAEIPSEGTDSATGAPVTTKEKVSGTVESILVKNFTVYAKLKGTGKEVPVAYITKISGEAVTQAPAEKPETPDKPEEDKPTTDEVKPEETDKPTEGSDGTDEGSQQTIVKPLM